MQSDEADCGPSVSRGTSALVLAPIYPLFGPQSGVSRAGRWQIGRPRTYVRFGCLGPIESRRRPEAIALDAIRLAALWILASEQPTAVRLPTWCHVPGRLLRLFHVEHPTISSHGLRAVCLGLLARLMSDSRKIVARIHSHWEPLRIEPAHQLRSSTKNGRRKADLSRSAKPYLTYRYLGMSCG